MQEIGADSSSHVGLLSNFVLHNADHRASSTTGPRPQRARRTVMAPTGVPPGRMVVFRPEARPSQPPRRSNGQRCQLECYRGFEILKPRSNQECRGRLAERTGFEPATSGVTGRHSNQLNYRSDGANPTDLPRFWWVLQGSNLRPTACKAVALPAELNTRFSKWPRMVARPEGVVKRITVRLRQIAGRGGDVVEAVDVDAAVDHQSFCVRQDFRARPRLIWHFAAASS